MKRVVVTISVLLVVAAAGLMMSRSDGDRSNTPAGASAPDADAADPPAALVPPPETAAAAAVAMTGDVVAAGLISRRELIESFTTPAFGRELADLTSEQLTSLRLSMTETGRDAAGLSATEFPLRAHATARGETTATVQVWSVLVVSSVDEPVARQAWRTVTVDLELVEGRWLVDGWQSTNGPSPAAAAEGDVASAADVAGVLGWQEVG